jgi:type VII secretion protein EccE
VFGSPTGVRADQSSPSGGLVHSVDIVPQRLVPLTALLVLQLFGVAGMVAARRLGIAGWHGAALGALLASVFVVRIRARTLPGWVALRAAYVWERRNRLRRSAVADPFDAETADGLQIGFRWDGKRLLSLVRIEENQQAMTVLEPGKTISGEILEIQLIADCLRQFDLTLDCIDVISQGARSHGHSPIAPVYDAVLGPLPAIAQRRTWVALRFDPTRCAHAVRRRGGGREGVVRAAATATRRVANRLIEAGLSPRVMTASEIAQATHELSDGVGIRNVEQTWRTCREGHFQLRTYLMKPTMLTTARLGLLWTIPSYSTTTCISLQRDDKHDVVKVRGLARFDSYGQSRIQLPGLQELAGQQFSALLATLPVPLSRRRLDLWSFGRGQAPLGNLAIPASGCGQVIGADDRGRAVALPLFGPQIRQVDICGGLRLAQQVLLRSLALGARVRVHTSRPAAWRDMVTHIGDRGLLWVADLGAATMQAGSDRNYSVEVFDGVATQSVRVGVSTIVVQPAGRAPCADSDVALQQLDNAPNAVKVSTAARSAVVTMVATPAELRYLTPAVDAWAEHPRLNQQQLHYQRALEVAQ